jgi:hypothetical protein
LKSEEDRKLKETEIVEKIIKDKERIARSDKRYIDHLEQENKRLKGNL